MNTKTGLFVVLALAASAFGCAFSPAEPAWCTLSDNHDGTSTFSCPDGSKTFLRNGSDGKDGASASAPAREPIGTAQGSFTIENALDAAQMSGIARITGDLVVTGAGLTSVSLPDLVEVEGTVHLVGGDLATIAFPKLAKIGGLHVEGTRLLSVQTFSGVRGKVGKVHFRDNARLGVLYGLEGITGADEIMIDNEPLLVSLNGLSGMAGHVKDGIVIFDNAELSSIDGLAGVASVGSANGLVVSANPKLTNVRMPSLEKVSTIGIALAGAASVSFPSLGSVEQGVSIANN